MADSPRPPLRRACAAAAVLLVFLAAACSTEDADEPESAPSPATEAATEAATESASGSDSGGDVADAADGEAAPLVLETADEGEWCFARGNPGDLAWFNVTWRAEQDLDSISFDLVEPRGVRVVGDTYSAPPVNFGGRIDHGGTATWEGRREALDVPQVQVSQMDSNEGWVPIEGQTALLVLHLRLDDAALASPDGAGFDGVRATWTDLEGGTGQVETSVPETFRTPC